MLGLRSRSSSSPQTFPHPAPPNNAPITVALDKIYKRLLLIENSVFVTPKTAKFPLSYADAVKNPTPAVRVLSEKFVPSRHLHQVTVKTISDAALLQSSS